MVKKNNYLLIVFVFVARKTMTEWIMYQQKMHMPKLKICHGKRIMSFECFMFSQWVYAFSPSLSFVRLFVRSFVRSFVRLFVRSRRWCLTYLHAASCWKEFWLSACRPTKRNCQLWSDKWFCKVGLVFKYYIIIHQLKNR